MQCQGTHLPPNRQSGVLHFCCVLEGYRACLFYIYDRHGFFCFFLRVSVAGVSVLLRVLLANVERLHDRGVVDLMLNVHLWIVSPRPTPLSLHPFAYDAPSTGHVLRCNPPNGRKVVCRSSGGSLTVCTNMECTSRSVDATNFIQHVLCIIYYV